jgi:DNA polymerase V
MEHYTLVIGEIVRLPLFSSGVSAGFPSPADDYVEGVIDLNELCIEHEAATYLVRNRGRSMIDVGIQDGDLLVVDRSVEPKSGKIVIATVNGEFTVKRYKKLRDRVWLEPANKDYPVIEILEETEFQVFGVVRWRIGAMP